MDVNIPPTFKKRIVIIGCGFAGLKLARNLNKKYFQVIIIDKNNYHQFQPLFYQVAASGIEPSTISFPLRKIFQNYNNVFIRITEVTKIDPQQKTVFSALGTIWYDYLVIASGADTSYFGMDALRTKAIPMKSVSEALYLRNKILQNFEDAVSCQNEEEKQRLLTICVVGGGPTGVEIAGSLAEMKKYVIPKDFKELNNNTINIYLLEASSKILGNMSVISSEKTKQFLKKTGVKIITDATVNNYDGKTVFINNNVEIQSSTLIWTAGITGNTLPGLSSTAYGKGNRLRVDSFNRINTYETIFAIGDIALMQTPEFPNGHPQVAQVAIQQARLLAKNLENLIANKSLIPFVYHDFGSMATIGRNLAVVEIGKFRSQGLLAWFIWMFVHLMAIVGVKNRLLIFINWFWNYITYDQSLRLIIKTKNKE